MALTMKPSITPKIRSVVAFLNFFDAARITMAAARAPRNAAPAVDMPGSVFPENPARPPSMVAMAAPKAAPELTPIMCGSARGFRSTLCIWAPASERAAPASMAVAMRGILRCNITWKSAVPPQDRSATASAISTATVPATAYGFFKDFTSQR